MSWNEFGIYDVYNIECVSETLKSMPSALLFRFHVVFLSYFFHSFVLPLLHFINIIIANYIKKKLLYYIEKQTKTVESAISSIVFDMNENRH